MGGDSVAIFIFVTTSYLLWHDLIRLYNALFNIFLRARGTFPEGNTY
jgi:hypothetical protein